MEKAVYVTLPENVITTLMAESKGNMSRMIREMLNDFDPDAAAKFLDTSRVGCRINTSAADKLKAEAEKLGVPIAKLAAAIIESKLKQATH